MPTMDRSRRINAPGLDLIKSFEGLHDGDPSTPTLEPRLCPAGVWTVGWGHALTADGRPLRGEADRAAAMDEWRRLWPAGMTPADAEALLRQDLATVETGIVRLCPVPLTDAQFSALVSLAYNIGLDALAGSTLRRLLLAGDITGAADQFPRWCRAGGRMLPGLVRRRAAERALFLTP